jgi:transposase InsO family protein
VLLAQRGLTVSESTINRILKREGLVRIGEVTGTASRRFERVRPNELWQMDFKGPYWLQSGRCIPLSILDDHSRYAIGLFALDNQLTETVHQALVNRFERYGVPEAILVDHGIPWWGNSNEHGLTRLSVSLIRQGIRLCFSGLRHPQTQGKVERFHRTISEMVRHHGRPTSLSAWQTRFDDFRKEYNQLRPHEALGLDVPAARYRPCKRPYQPDPPEWEYSAGANVIRLNQQGMLPWRGQRFFVCEALAHERVQVTECQDKLLIRFRHTWIREVDPKNGRSATLIDKNQEPYV